MLIRLIGCASFAIIALIVIIAGFVNRDTDTENHASSSVLPAFTRDSLPVSDVVDATVEGALHKVAFQSAPTDGVTDNNAPLSPEAVDPAPLDSRSTNKAKGVKPRTSFTTLPLLAKTAASSLELQAFTPLLEAEGFARTRWQDFNYDMGVTYKHNMVEPFVVMIDPGHGGIDPGSVGYNGLVEKDLTLDIAQRVRLFLTEFDDIDVHLTRNYDHGLSRQSRVSAIQRSDADMVISLHFNNLPEDNVNVVESYFAGPANIVESVTDRRAKDSLPLHHISNKSMRDVDLGFTSGSARLAKSLHQRMYSEVSFGDREVYDAGVKQETLFVLTRSFTPAVLLEISCLSDDEEADRLLTEEYKNRLAAALVDGIRDYHESLKTDPLVRKGDLGA